MISFEAYTDEMVKISKIFGASSPSEDYMLSGVPHARKEKALHSYWERKGREKPTSWGSALGAGGVLGGLAGAGLGASGGLGGAAGGAVLGALGGAGLGALLRKSDKAKIRRSRRRAKRGPSYLRAKTERKVVGAHAATRRRAAQRHHETMSAIKESRRSRR